jgi:beta-lactam-binding protein with PASTA domain
MVTVPQLYGKSYLDAKKALEDLGLLIRSGGTLSTSPNASVTTQSVAASTEVPMGTIIDVTLVDKSIVGTY